MPNTPNFGIYYADTSTPLSIENITSAQATSIENALNGALVNRVYLACSYSQPSSGGLSTITAWTTEYADPLDWHNPSTNPERITPNVAGNYLVEAFIMFGANSSGVRWVLITLNGGTILAETRVDTAPSAFNRTGLFVRGLTTMNGTTDYVTVSVLQNSGSALVVDGSFSVTKIA